MNRTPPGLGPHCVGLRVVVRRVLPGQTGPTGGPAMTDLLGVLEAWAPPVCAVRAEDGALVEIALADIVSGKPVPPRTSVRQRVTPADAQHRALGCWPATETAALGDWVLRAAGGYSGRANSVLAAGDPGLPFADALAVVREFYAARSLPACAQVVVGSDEQAGLEAAGWVPARPGEADTVFALASVARASRTARRLLPAGPPPVEARASVTPAWLADEARALAAGRHALDVLEGPAEVAFLSVSAPDGTVLAKGRVALADGGPDPWAGLTNLWVDPAHRRRRLAVVVMAALLEWAAERGATTAFLQALGDNAAGLALHERLGFVAHHAYHYFTPA